VRAARKVATKKSLHEIYDTPVLWLSEDDIERLDLKSQIWVRRLQAMRRRHNACRRHERVLISSKNGWLSGKCRFCSMDMSYQGGQPMRCE
jgi:biotin synthase-like enzyme